MTTACSSCQRVMDPGNGCLTTVEPPADGVLWARRPYGTLGTLNIGLTTQLDPADATAANEELWATPGKTCHDCKVHLGQLHHPGCDMERCPHCGRQSLGCGHYPPHPDDVEDL